ncbi:MAG: DUF2780 domain-containing protein [Methyloprofundus sp.]|nr:DUF2780 domain-containing protein [Methyloprofundus sp.]MBW6453724.1 DUF2780 domain-containing protein [Methyloprofundus sp.]
MTTKHVLALTASSLLALTLTGCATQPAGTATINQGLNATQSALNTTQSVVNMAQAAQSANLTSLLTQQLGISSAQAAGGAGALFQAAQSKMSAGDFQQLTQSVPEVSGLMSAVAQPKPSGLSQIASGASALMGDESNTLGTAANLYSTFESLGLSGDMVSQFAPVITDYVSKNATSYLTKALTSALTGL